MSYLRELRRSRPETRRSLTSPAPCVRIPIWQATGGALGYAYTYDDGDNLFTKVEPFSDDFNDGNLTGWTASGSWRWWGAVLGRGSAQAERKLW